MIPVYVDVAFDNGPLEQYPNWTTLDAVKRVTITQGRQTSIGRIEAGRCTVLLQSDSRRYDPTNSMSAQYGNGYRIEPGKRVRVRAGTTPYETMLFTGNVTGWHQDYDARGLALPEIRLEAVDAFGYFGTRTLSTVITFQWPWERIHAILTALGWPLAWRLISSTSNTPRLASTDYTGVNALDALQTAAMAQRGAIWMDGDGRVVYMSGNDRVYETAYPLDVSFGGSGGERPFRDAKVVYDRAEIYNEVSITPKSGLTQTATSGTAGAYFTSPYTATIPLQYETDALNLATTIATRYGNPQRRVSQLTVANSFSDSDWNGLLTTTIVGGRVGVRITPSVGSDIYIRSYVEGLRHDIPADGIWQITYHLTPAAYYSGWLMNTSTLNIDTFAA